MTALRVPSISAADYLESEERAQMKHEFVSGFVYLMAGAKPAHNQIAVKIISRLDAALEETKCLVYNSDQRVRNQAGDTYFYPDCSVACGPKFDAKDSTSLINPVLVCEVLSPATQAYDLGDKADRYARFDSLRAMLLVSSEEVRVELRERADPKSVEWITTVLTRREDTVRIAALDVELSLSSIYAKTEMPPAIRVEDE